MGHDSSPRRPRAAETFVKTEITHIAANSFAQGPAACLHAVTRAGMPYGRRSMDSPTGHAARSAVPTTTSNGKPWCSASTAVSSPSAGHRNVPMKTHHDTAPAAKRRDHEGAMGTYMSWWNAPDHRGIAPLFCSPAAAIIPLLSSRYSLRGGGGAARSAPTQACAGAQQQLPTRCGGGQPDCKAAQPKREIGVHLPGACVGGADHAWRGRSPRDGLGPP